MTAEISAAETATQLERASRLIHSASHADGLYPAQWSALRYFAGAPAAIRTAGALARFQGMNLGPVARTVRTLVDKGLLARVPNPANRRADRLEVTPKGAALLARDPRRALEDRLSALPPADLAKFSETLETLLEGLFQDWKGSADPVSALAQD